MVFKDSLLHFINKYNCTSRELAHYSGLSQATISRFRNGERIPAASSDKINMLAGGILKIARQRGDDHLTHEGIIYALCAHLDEQNDKEKFRENLNSLIAALSMSVSALSKSINYDASLISRIRSGARQPKDTTRLAEAIAEYVVRRYTDEASLAIISMLLGCDASALYNTLEYRDRLLHYLISNNAVRHESPSDFLQKLDEFNLDQYLNSVRFDDFKIPTVPFQLPAVKTYTGIDGFKRAELDWLKATVLSKSMEPVLMYSDMPIEQMAKDADFSKKWMFGMALLLKKGLVIKQVHNLDRSLREMLLGLESWIPLYMTGQVYPYYFKQINSTVFLNMLKVSGNSVLIGEAIAGHHTEGRYTFVRANDEVNYHKRRGEAMLSKALPLMDIYTKSKAAEFTAFWQKNLETMCERRSILSTLPFYTLSEELLNRIMQRNCVDEGEQTMLREHLLTTKRSVLKMLEHGSVCDNIPVLTREAFLNHPMSFSISEIFYNRDVDYTYDEYLEHLALTRLFEADHANYHLADNTQPLYCNIQIHIMKDRLAIVSKNKAPAIHFVIKHPKLRDSIERMSHRT